METAVRLMIYRSFAGKKAAFGISHGKLEWWIYSPVIIGYSKSNRLDGLLRNLPKAGLYV